LLHGTLFSPASIDFTSSESQPLLIDSYLNDEVSMTPKDNIEGIDPEHVKQAGQMLLDTIIYSFAGGHNR